MPECGEAGRTIANSPARVNPVTGASGHLLQPFSRFREAISTAWSSAVGPAGQARAQRPDHALHGVIDRRLLVLDEGDSGVAGDHR